MSELNKSYYQSLSTLIGSDPMLKKALETFEQYGIPDKKQEDYKYTNMQSFLPTALKIASPKEANANFKQQLESLGALPSPYKLVLGNGAFLKELSHLPEFLSVQEKEEVNQNSCTLDSFSAINMIGLRKSITVKVERSQKVPLINIVHLQTPVENETMITRVSIQAQELSQSAFLEIFHAPGEEKKSFSNSLTTIELAKGSHLTHVKAPITGDAHGHVGKVTANLERDAHLTSLTFSVTGRLNRNNIEVFCNGEGSHASVNGLYTGRSKQHHDSFCHVHHKAAHTTSTQLFKGILDDESRGVFTGKIIVHRDAQQVDSSQLNKTLLLSQKAHVDTRPQIEVYADDVKCGHGATVGQINEEEVFYLESRGIPRQKAQKILCHAFTQEVIDTCEDKEVRAWLSSQLFDSFEKYALEKLDQQGK